MITKVNSGVCAARIQEGKPPYFVNYQEDGKNEYKFFSTVFDMYKFKESIPKK